MRCSNCCSTIPLLRNSSSKRPARIQSSIFSPLRFTLFITSAVSMVTPLYPRLGGPRKLVVSHGTGALPRTSPNNVILLHRHHTHPWLPEPSSEACFHHVVCVDILYACVRVCVCVVSLPGEMPSSLSPCVECGGQSRPGVCEREITVEGEKLVKPTQFERKNQNFNRSDVIASAISKSRKGYCVT